MKVVVVGNGESVLNHTYGDFIDKCDRVIRINKFVIDGYKKHVGSKLDIYCAKWHKITYRDKHFLQQHNEFWFPHPKPPTGWGALKGAIYLDEKSHDKYICQTNIDNKVIKFLDNETRINLDNIFDNNEPSIGIVAIEMAKSIFPSAVLYIIGFDGMQTGWYWDPSHDCLNDCRNSIIHEKLYLSKHEANKLERSKK